MGIDDGAIHRSAVDDIKFRIPDPEPGQVCVLHFERAAAGRSLNIGVRCDREKQSTLIVSVDVRRRTAAGDIDPAVTFERDAVRHAAAADFHAAGDRGVDRRAAAGDPDRSFDSKPGKDSVLHFERTAVMGPLEKGARYDGQIHLSVFPGGNVQRRSAAGERQDPVADEGDRVRRAAAGEMDPAEIMDFRVICRASAGDINAAVGIDRGAVREAAGTDPHRPAGIDRGADCRAAGADVHCVVVQNASGAGHTTFYQDVRHEGDPFMFGNISS